MCAGKVFPKNGVLYAMKLASLLLHWGPFHTSLTGICPTELFLDKLIEMRFDYDDKIKLLALCVFLCSVTPTVYKK